MPWVIRRSDPHSGASGARRLFRGHVPPATLRQDRAAVPGGR